MKLDATNLPALPEPPFCSQCGQTVNEFTCGPTHAIMRHEWQTLDRLACARAGALAALDEAAEEVAGHWNNKSFMVNQCEQAARSAAAIRRLRDTIMEGK